MLPLSAIHAGTTIHNKQKRISRYLPYIEQKLFISGDTTQQVQRRYQIHCDTQCSANTEDYMQLQWHRNTSHYMQLQWHTNTSHTTETMTTQRHITLHMLWYANTEDYMQPFIIYNRNHDTHKDVYYFTCYDMPSNKYNVRLQYTYNETHTVWNTKTYAHTSIAQWSHWVIYMRAPRLNNKRKESPNTCPAESQYIA